MTMKHFVRSLLLLCLGASVLDAGGPMRVTSGGQPIRWNPASPISYRLDQGAMGAFSNATATTIADESFKVWDDVATATISFVKGSVLPVDVDGTNFTSYLNATNNGINAIIFDSDGSIIEDISPGASGTAIGLAIAYDNGTTYYKTVAVMNGLMAENPFTPAQFKSTFIHEFGHCIGLDHTQINAQFAGDNNTANDQYIPTMFPTSSDDDTQLATLNPDDIAAVSTLYPTPTFAATTGSITGTVTRQDASPVLGAVVVAISTTDSLLTQISTVTDYLKQSNGSYTISGLAPGSYWVKLEPVNPAFDEGSSIGPYADDASGLSFVNPVSVEYFNGAGESGDPALDTAWMRVAVPVAAGSPSVANMVVENVEAAPSTPGILKNFGPPSTTFSLPSIYGDLKYAVRFTPDMAAPLEKVAFMLREAPFGIRGTGTLRVSVHSNKAGSWEGGIPDAQIGSAITRPFSSLNAGVFNEVDLTPLAVTVQQNVDFHIVFEVLGAVGDTLKFFGDYAEVPTTRSSSYYDPGPLDHDNNPATPEVDPPLAWYNFISDSNYQGGYNLVVRAYLTVPSGANGENLVLLPDGFALDQNFPNPFNPATTIPFRLSEAGRVAIDVFDVLGRKVATVLEQQEYPAGDHRVSFNAQGLASGTYVAVMSFEGHRRPLKMLLLR